MSQRDFVHRYEPQWQAFATLLDGLGAPKGWPRRKPSNLGDYPFLYRRVCQHLALARARDYDAYVIDRLNQLVLRGHQHLYGSRSGVWSKIVEVALSEFPSRARRERALFWIAAVLMLVPAVGMAIATIRTPDLVYSVLDPAEVDMFEEMYDPDGERLGRERESDTDFMMFGYYIYNNISIAFEVFAGGVILGLGSVAALVLNGVYFGVVAGHLTNLGSGEPFYGFVIAHGAFELTAIVLAGMAGLKLGLSWLAPGRLARVRALREAARDCVPVVYGMVVMLVMAAFVEAFWSSSTQLAYWIKYAAGGVCWALVIAYFVLLGRRNES